MTRKTLCLFAGCLLAALVVSPFRAGARDDSMQSKLIGKWINQNETKGPAVINITAADAATGPLKRKKFPPSRGAAGKEIHTVRRGRSPPTAPPKGQCEPVRLPRRA